MPDPTKGRAKFERHPDQTDLIDFIVARKKREPQEIRCIGYETGTCLCQACCDQEDAEIERFCKENGIE